MSKIRSDSSLNGLAPEQQALLEGWLFEDNAGYQAACERVQQQFGLTVSADSMGRYCRRVAQARVVADLAETEQVAHEVNGTTLKLEGLKSSALKIIGKTFLEKALMGGEVKELAALGRLLFEQENRETQRSRAVLARERFELRAVETALAQKSKFSEEDLDDLDIEYDWVHEIKARLLGRDPMDGPKAEPQPAAGEKKNCG